MWQIARSSSRPFALLMLGSLVLLVVLTACGGSPTATRTRSNTITASAAPSAAPAASSALRVVRAPRQHRAGSGCSDGDQERPGSRGQRRPEWQHRAPGLTPPQYVPIVTTRQLIKTGTVSMVVQDVDVSFEDALKIAQENGGDLLQYTNTKTGDRRVADLILQVDSKNFEQAMKALRGMKGIIERKVDKADVKEVTDEVVDVQAQIKNLEITEQQLRALLERTNRTDEILTIQREINNVRVQIDRLQTRGNQLADQSDLSTITLHLESGPPVAPPSESPATTAWDPGTIIGRAWYASLAILQGVGTVVITIAVFCWWMVPLLLVAWFLYRRYRRTAPTRPSPTPPTPPAAASS